MKRALKCTLLALALMGAAAAHAGTVGTVLLSDLFGVPGTPGASITAGDKTFSRFTLQSDTGTAWNPNLISVSGVAGGLNPGPGLNFSAAQGAWAVTGDDSLYNFINFQFAYLVEAASGFFVNGTTLSINDFSVLGFDATNGDEFASIFIQSWLGAAAEPVPADPPNLVEVEFSRLGGDFTSVLSATHGVVPAGSYWVTTNVLIEASALTDSAALSGFTQLFSQQVRGGGTVPEPGTLALAALALVGMVKGRRRAQA